jgi:transcriptional regulator with XRE-family HTH domain
MSKSYQQMSPDELVKDKKDFSIKLGKAIRQVREQKQLSQEQLADKAGYYRTYIGHIETATYSPSTYTLWRIAQALDVDVAEILKGL